MCFTRAHEVNMRSTAKLLTTITFVSYLLLQAKPKVKQEVEQEECPLYKVLLIGDEEYERDHVVMAIQVRILAIVSALVH
jgi:hypothetical protein